MLPILDIFKEITTIPRESGHEENMRRWLLVWAAAHNCESKVDSTGNVLIIKEASPGKENVPTLVLQAHQDMVCEKREGVTFDFARDPIRYEIEDGWMVSKDTTLGADDGSGIAASLALIQSGIPTGRLECLFTVCEETGMDGAENLAADFFSGSTMINLDSEDEGVFCIGCAGGLNVKATYPVDRKPVKGGVCVKLDVTNGLGGHSGCDIAKGRCNTLQTLVRFIFSEVRNGACLVSIDAGGKINTIARTANALVVTSDPDSLRRRFEGFGKAVRGEFHVTDPGLQFSSETEALPSEALSDECSWRLLASLLSCPHGVERMSRDIPGLVETSNNLASIHTFGDRIEVYCHPRSSTPSELDFEVDRIKASLSLGGAEVVESPRYPGWKPNVSSALLKRMSDSYLRLFGKSPKVEAIHAGLECGLILGKRPDLDVVSTGPTIHNIHTPGEKMDLSSLDRLSALLEDVVTNFE